MIAMCYSNYQYRIFLEKNPWVLGISGGMMAFFYVLMISSRKVAKSKPANFII